MSNSEDSSGRWGGGGGERSTDGHGEVVGGNEGVEGHLITPRRKYEGIKPILLFEHSASGPNRVGECELRARWFSSVTKKTRVKGVNIVRPVIWKDRFTDMSVLYDYIRFTSSVKTHMSSQVDFHPNGIP